MADGVDLLPILGVLKDWGLPTILGGVMALMYRTGSKVGQLEKFVTDQVDLNKKVERRLDDHETNQSQMQVKLATLPTRDEMQGMISELKSDLRQDLRSFRDVPGRGGGSKTY